MWDCPNNLLCISLLSLCLTTGQHAVLHYHVVPALKELPLPNCVDKHSSGELHPQGCYYICSQHQPGGLVLLLYFFLGNWEFQVSTESMTLAAPFDIMCQVCLLSQCQGGICKLLSVRCTGLSICFQYFISIFWGSFLVVEYQVTQCMFHLFAC
jgi:hypothetical protein